MTKDRTTDFSEARELQWAWKTSAMEAMAVAVCELALERGARNGGTGEFSANDLAAFDHGGQGIAGSVFKELAKWEVIAPVMLWAGSEHQQKYVRNSGGNLVRVWRLKSAARAQRLLELHAAQPPKTFVQTDLLVGP